MLAFLNLATLGFSFGVIQTNTTFSWVVRRILWALCALLIALIWQSTGSHIPRSPQLTESCGQVSGYLFESGIILSTYLQTYTYSLHLFTIHNSHETATIH